jgi:hypothetical protein
VINEDKRQKYDDERSGTGTTLDRAWRGRLTRTCGRGIAVMGLGRREQESLLHGITVKV